MISLKFKLEGVAELSRKLEDISSKDFQDEMDSIGKKIVQYVQDDVFDSEGRVLGEPWVDGPYYNGLVRTGRLVNGFYYVAGTTWCVVGNNTNYFKFHQSRKPRKSNLPRRVMLKLNDELKDMAVKEIQKSFQEELKGR